MAILDQYGKPLNTSRAVSAPSRDAGALRGSISGWRGKNVGSQAGATHERELMQRRAGDLYVNDWAAYSAVETIGSNAIGTGLVPKLRIPAHLLGITPEEAHEIAERIEWEWALWAAQADARGLCTFEDLQLLGLRSMLSLGEMLHVAVMLPEAERIAQGREYSLAVQALSPLRLMTPPMLEADPAVRDGIRFSNYGRPEVYYVATPQAYAGEVLTSLDALAPEDFTELPARSAHRTCVFHLFEHQHDEQTRGASVFSRSISHYRHLADAIDYELFAQVISASFPVFISNEQRPQLLAPGMELEEDEDGRRIYQNIEPGQILYGNNGEQPVPLESKRPSANFNSFCELILRSMAAMTGTTYEEITRDYSKTNYSSARAALNQAWKKYRYYRLYFGRHYCQPFLEMLIEEAILRGRIVLPASAPDFYAARSLWCNADWIGPARGFVDPVKEIQALVLALQNRLMTYDEAWGERGGDFEEGIEQLAREQRIMSDMGLTSNASAPATSAPTENEEQNNA